MKNAYVTLLSSKDYLPAILILNKNLKDVNSIFPLCVMVTDNIINEVEPYLLKENILYKIIPYLMPSNQIIENFQDTPLLNTFSKFAVFKLVDFEKVVYLDADIIIYKNIDDLFYYPDGAMYDDNGFGFSGLFVTSPKNHNANFYYALSKIFNLTDGTILEQIFFPFKSNPCYRIPFEYFLNITLENLDSFYIENFKIIHFCYKYKPWHYKTEQEYLNNFKKEFKYSMFNREKIIFNYFENYLIPLRKQYPEFNFLQIPNYDNPNLKKLN